MRKSIPVRLGLALGVPAVVLAGLEGGARLYLGDARLTDLPTGRSMDACAVRDPELGWVNKPGVRTRVEGPKLSYGVEINDRGLRDREHAYEKPDGVLRVALLGDSLAWGWGVDNGLCFADLAEAELGPGVEIINLGVPGYSNDQHLWMLEREGARYHPDLVLLCFTLNDVVGNGETESDEFAKPRYVRGPAGDWVLENSPVPMGDPPEPRAAFREWLWVHSGFLQLLQPADSERELVREGREVVGRRQLTAAQASMLESEQAEVRALADEIADPESVTYMLLSRLHAACAELGVPLVAFSIAHHHDRYLYSPGSPIPPRDASGREHRTDVTVRLAEAGQRIGFQTFSVDQAMLSETEAGVGLACGDGHLNERGNEVVAGRIAEELRALLSGLRAGAPAGTER